MKLKQIKQKESTTKVTWTLKTSAVKMLQEYQALYKAKYGEEISQNLLAEEILQTFISEDKEFKSFVSKQTDSN